MKPHRRQQGKAAVDLIEEAVHLLRLAPAGTLVCYYLGSLPFVLGFLYFWTDMSRSAFADQHLAAAALGVALLFLWMKCWQAIFARRMRDQLAGDTPSRWAGRKVLRVLLIQIAVQPSGLFLLPLAALPVLPFPWAFAFYQNVTVLADGETGEMKHVLKKAGRLAWFWPKQNWLGLFFVILFGLAVFLNWVMVGPTLPQLARMFFGVESVFTQSPLSMLNTTFFAAMIGLTYLCVDPIIKTVYVLRCFYGESLSSGEDLKTALKSSSAVIAPLAAGLVLLGSLNCAAEVKSTQLPAEVAAPTQVHQGSSPAVSVPELDRAISEVIHQRKYSWRLPREKKAEDESARKGIVARFVERVGNLLRQWARAVWDWLVDLLERLFKRKAAGGKSGFGWIGSLQGLILLLIAVVVSALAILLLRLWQRLKQKAAVKSEAIFPAPDITDESIGAEQLPEDGWIKSGRELLARGELRLAVRAFYLASLAHLAGRNMITLAKFKSNRDYERELQRRGHSLPDLLSCFGENVSVFDRIWYGGHDVNLEMANEFLANLERIKTGA